jgi:L,D-transpeptidase catalytic domain
MPKDATMRRMRLPLPLLAGLALPAALLLAAPTPVPARGPDPAPPAPAAAAAHLVPAPPGDGLDAPALLAINRWLRPGEHMWDDDGVPAGGLTIVVDLRARTLSVYRAGMEIGRSFITHGADNKPTPTGRFPILEKDADHHSNLYDNAPMPWMLRLTRDGVAIHGAEIADDAATRGCVGLPAEFAEMLFRHARLGDPVLVVPGPPPGKNYAFYAALPVQPDPSAAPHLPSRKPPAGLR